jgi:hypothetical protein
MERTEIGALLVKEEANYGVDSAPTGTNVIPAIGDSLGWSIDSEQVKRRPLYDHSDPMPGLNVLPNVTLKFGWEVRGASGLNLTDAAFPEVHPLLKAADLAAVYTIPSPPGSGNGYWTYSPHYQLESGPSVTCWWETGQKVHKMVGGKVDLDLVMEAGKMIVVNFTVRGKYVAVIDGGLSGSLAAVDMIPPTFEGATVSFTPYGGSAYTGLVVSQIQAALNNTITMRRDALATDGVAGFQITGYAPTWKLNPESVTIAAQPLYAGWRADAVNTLVASVNGGTANKFTATLLAQINSIGYSADGGRRIVELAGDCVRNRYSGAAGDLFQLKFA